MSEEKNVKQQPEDMSPEEVKEVIKAHRDVVYSGNRKAFVDAVRGIMANKEDMERFAAEVAKHFGED